MAFSNNSREKGKLYYNAKVRPRHEKYMQLKNKQWLFALYKEYWKHQWIPGTSRPRSPLWHDPMIVERKSSRRPSVIPEYPRESMLHWKHNNPDEIEEVYEPPHDNFPKRRFWLTLPAEEDFTSFDDNGKDGSQHEVFQHQVHCTEENTPVVSGHTSVNIGSEHEHQSQKDSETGWCFISDEDAYDSLDEELISPNEEVKHVEADNLEEVKHVEADNLEEVKHVEADNLEEVKHVEADNLEEVKHVEADNLEEVKNQTEGTIKKEENEEEEKIEVKKVDETSTQINSKLDGDKPLLTVNYVLETNVGDGDTFFSSLLESKTTPLPPLTNQKTTQCNTGLSDPDFKSAPTVAQSPVQEPNQEYYLNENEEKCVIRKPRRSNRNSMVKEENYSFDVLDQELFKGMNYKNLNQTDHCEDKVETTASVSKSVIHISSHRSSKTEISLGSRRSSRNRIFRGSSDPSSLLHSILFNAESFKSIQERESSPNPSVKVFTTLPPVQSKQPTASAKQSTDNFQEYIDCTIDECGSNREIYFSGRNCVINRHRESWETMNDDLCEFNEFTFQAAAPKENIYDDLKVFLGARKAKSILSAQKRQKSREKQAQAN